MVKQVAFFVSFAIFGFLAVLGAQDTMRELPNFIVYHNTYDCTFACGSRMVLGFWNVAAVTFLFASVALGSLFGFILGYNK